ncbi:cAMP phosphodiesterases class-II-domain-containing protein [Annulohypoxylon maeteangense]|uniref:cAMP phosphodiesterases class-II-domain-containing protein n=1 Tax=Annulohypoxylon maeteangense TaxID=1927788 RepID=UPI0020083D4C|nr:cAMP phosphodiesterases class-II-domain-containing protein [Annulohypoxylon maeteangense]KAI0887127.1 cAMP phosphodiesterases class-II-domain-containing protein [Annulohypoxylon maeteangense]
MEPWSIKICHGSGGGPQEHNVTALLIRSVRSGWNRGSTIALDAGVHLSAITRILEDTQPKGLGTQIPLPHVLESGPFAGLEIQTDCAATNAACVTRHLIDTYLITHPHLDHICGFVINTAGLPVTRPKRIAGLPSTISAFKTHIFNNVIWPNLSDENNGAGLVTYTRLVEGGSPALGEGAGKGYLEISDDLSVKVFSISHGHCIERHTHRGSTSSSRFGSVDISSMASPRGVQGSNAASGPSPLLRSSGVGRSSVIQESESVCVYDSSAYFIRDSVSGREVLMFGDVEPDSISLSPRNLGVWQEAAPRIANGSLAAIFIECSYDDSQTDDLLFGHLTPRYIIEEMKVLATEVEAIRQTPAKFEPNKKRKRELEEASRKASRNIAKPGRDDGPVSPKSIRPRRSGSGSLPPSESGFDSPQLLSPTAEMSSKEFEANMTPPPLRRHTPNRLKGLKVVIIHVKEKLLGGEKPGNIILRELLNHEKEAKLGCEFIVSKMGQSLLF